MTIGAIARSAYVRLMRVQRPILRSLGILDWLERKQTRGALWMRSLYAIYDFNDLAKLGLPWWTFDAIGAVERFLASRPNARVFEFGSGASTLWLAPRALEIHSVEHDRDWLAKVEARTRTLANVTIRGVPGAKGSGSAHSGKPGFEDCCFDDYVAAIREAGGTFDLIVIDGRARAACLAEARNWLAPDGIILLDNSKRARYQRAIAKSGLERWRAAGLAVSLPYPDATTLLARNRETLDRIRR